MNQLIIEKLNSIEKMLKHQSLLKKEVLTSREAAIYLGLSLSYLYELASQKTIPAYKPNGGKLYFKRKELYNWMLSKRKASNCEMREVASGASLKMGVESDCKSLDPNQFLPNTRRN